MINITLDDREQQALMRLVNAALKHEGEAALDIAAHFKAKLIQANQSAQLPPRAAGNEDARQAG